MHATVFSFLIGTEWVLGHIQFPACHMLKIARIGCLTRFSLLYALPIIMA
jgi:hypothetical protein